MKKSVFLAVGILFLFCGFAFSQAQTTATPDVFVKTVPVAKIYTHVLGYKVVYVKSTLEMGTLYLPLTWFGKSAGKAMIVWQSPAEPTHFSIFWVDGKFDHIVLYAPENMGSPVWGVLETSEDVTPLFNVDEPKVSF